MASDDLKKITDKLIEINKVITKLDPAIRGQAFELLEPFFFEDALQDQKGGGAKKKKKRETLAEGKEEFFNSNEHDKPKDNVSLIVAWLYSQYGVFPISRVMLDEEASDAGLTIPERSDNTMRQTKQKRKSLFRQKSGGWQLTVAGEAYMKEKYSVKKGNKELPEMEVE